MPVVAIDGTMTGRAALHCIKLQPHAGGESVTSLAIVPAAARWPIAPAFVKRTTGGQWGTSRQVDRRQSSRETLSHKKESDAAMEDEPMKQAVNSQSGVKSLGDELLKPVSSAGHFTSMFLNIDLPWQGVTSGRTLLFCCSGASNYFLRACGRGK